MKSTGSKKWGRARIALRWTTVIVLFLALAFSVGRLTGCGSNFAFLVEGESDFLDEGEPDKVEGSLFRKYADLKGNPVTEIALSEFDVIDDRFIVNLRDYPELERLEIFACFSITDRGLKQLRHLTGLQSLTLRGLYGVSGRGFEGIRNLKKIRELYIAGTAFSDVGLQYIKNWAGLKELTLDSTAVTDNGLPLVAAHTQLERLVLSGTGLSRTAMAGWGTLKKLQYTGNNGFTDAGIAHLKALKNLKLLGLPETIGDPGLKHLQGFVGLEGLWLIGTRVTDDGLVNLADMENLKELSLFEAKVITGKNFERLPRSLRKLTIADTKIGDDAMIHVAKLPELRDLIAWKTRITDVGVREFKGHKNLERLDLNWCAEVSDNALATISGLPNLHTVGLSGTQVSDAGLPLLYNMKNLNAINLLGADVTERGRDALQKALPKASISWVER